MAEFKPVDVVTFPHVGPKITADTIHWKQLDFPVAIREYGAIDYVDFTQQEPFSVAVTCSSKVQIYNPADNKVRNTLSRFKKTAYGGVFRHDGKLLVAGSEDGFLRLFEVQSSKPLRIFKGHHAATHRCNFTKDGVHIVSFSDDQSVGLWDIPTETRLTSFKEHSDYIRAGAVSQASQDVLVSGSYDHLIKMYDTRSKSSILSMNHGSPVESILMFPSGGLLLSAGGINVKVWDLVAGRLLSQITQHNKTVTSLCFASNGRRLMSGSLDRHVKIYDVTSYEVVHTLDYPSPVLSVAAAPEDKVVVVGMSDGLLSIRHQKEPKSQRKSREERKKRKTYFQYKLYGTDFKPANGDIIVPEVKPSILKAYDRHLRNFEFSRALDVVLKEYVQRNHPEVTFSVMMELIRRGTIKSALAGREGESLLPLMKFTTKYISDPRFSRILTDVALMLTDIYGSKLTDLTTRNMFQVLQRAIENEVECMREMLEVQGMIQSVLSVTLSNNVVQEPLESDNDNKSL